MLMAFFFGFKDSKSCASGEFLPVFHKRKLMGPDRRIAQESRQPAKSALDGEFQRPLAANLHQIRGDACGAAALDCIHSRYSFAFFIDYKNGDVKTIIVL